MRRGWIEKERTRTGGGFWRRGGDRRYVKPRDVGGGEEGKEKGGGYGLRREWGWIGGGNLWECGAVMMWDL